MDRKNWKFTYKDKKMEERIDDFLSGNFTVVKELKNDHRSLVQLVEIKGEQYVYKVPREKNGRKWQRIVNVLRGSDSLRNYQAMEKLEGMNIKSTRALLAGEKRTPLVVDSFLVMEYLEAQELEKSDYPRVIETLNYIHSLGYLHGDSQIQNFLKNDNEIIAIDFRLQKNIYGDIGRKYEFIYLSKSLPEITELYGEMTETLSYKIANLYKEWLYFHGRVRKRLKGKKD